MKNSAKACPDCGQATKEGVEKCPNCGAELETVSMLDVLQDDISEYKGEDIDRSLKPSGSLWGSIYRVISTGAFISLLLASLVLILVWELLVFFLPGGAWVLPMDIFFYLTSVVFLFYISWYLFQKALPIWLSFVLSALLWAGFVFGIKYLFHLMLTAFFA